MLSKTLRKECEDFSSSNEIYWPTHGLKKDKNLERVMRKFQQRYGLEYNRVMITLLFNESLCIDHWREKILLSPVLSCQDRTEIYSYVT